MSAPEPAPTKLAEQATSKGSLSYSFWTNTNAPANSEVQPVRIRSSEPQQQEAAAAAGTSAAAASAWNKAGTFEERDLTEWATQRLQDMLVGTSNNGVVVTKCKSISGSANIWFIRGKKRHGFDYQVELEWGQQGSSAAGLGVPRGVIKVPSASPDDLDDLHVDVCLEAGSGDAAADEAARQSAKALKQPLQQVLVQFLAELRSR